MSKCHFLLFGDKFDYKDTKLFTTMKKNIRDPFFSMFDDVFLTPKLTYSPDVKVIKDETEYKLFISVPGLTKDDLKISIKDSEMLITFAKDDENENHYFVKNFTKKYIIPEDVKEHEIEARVENGVLSVFLPLLKRKPSERLLSIK